MKSEWLKGELLPHDEIDVPDYRDISPDDIEGLNNERDKNRETLRHFEAYRAQEAERLQSEFDRLHKERDEALSNGEKIELDAAIDAVQAEFDALGMTEQSSHENIPVEYRVVEDEPTDQVPEVENDTPGEKQVDAEVEEPVNEGPTEHWELKRAMREAKQAYLRKLEADVEQRGALKKMFGFGQKEMTPEVQAAYNEFMAANQAYYHYADESGRYQKINDWQKRRQENSGQVVEPMGIYGAVADRHVLKPASERLALQERQMPPAVLKLFKTIGGNPYLKWGLLGTSVLATAGGSLFGILGGKATKWGLERTYVRGKEKQHEVEAQEITNVLVTHELIDLDLLEQEYFASGLAIDTARFRTNAASMAVGAAATAGAGYTIGSEFYVEGLDMGGGIVDGTVKPISPNDLGLVAEPAPTASPIGSTGEAVGNTFFGEVRPGGEMNFGSGSIDDQLGIKEVSSYDTNTFIEDALKAAREVGEKSVATPEAAIEKLVTVKPSDTMSELLYDTIKERVAAGKLTIPPGQSVGQYLYQNFPELTNATDVAGRLTPEEWVKLGVSSGNPDQIAVGEVIDMQALLDKLPSSTADTATSATVDSMPVQSVPNEVTAMGEVRTETPPATPPKVADSVDNTVTNTHQATSETRVETSAVRPSSQVTESSFDTAADTTRPISEVKVVSKGTILNSRFGPEATLYYENLHGYQPQMSPEFSKSVVHFSNAVSKNAFAYELYQRTLEAYRTGDINLPAEIVRRVADNPTSINAFVDRNAAEFAGVNPFLSTKPLGLTSDEWRGLGFSSGNPTMITAGDTIKMGELVERILESAAKKLNGKIPV